MPRRSELGLILERLVLPARARMLVAHAVSAEPLIELRELSAGGQVVAVAPTLAEYTALQKALAGKAGAEITVTLENLSEPLSGEPFDAALVDTDGPSARGNAYTRQLINWTVGQIRAGCFVWLVGSNRRGLQTFVRHLSTCCADVVLVAVGGGQRAYRGAAERAAPTGEDAPPAEPTTIEVAVQDVRFTLRLQPGVFSARKLDEATELLIGGLQIHRRAEVLDLGCGAGPIGIAAALLAPEGRATLADSNPMAVALAERNVAANGILNAAVLLSDGYSALADQRFDVIATNPPFHQHGRDARDTAERFIREAPDHLLPGGHCYVVANAFLAYERLMTDVFGAVETVVATPSYKVLRSERRVERRPEF